MKNGKRLVLPAAALCAVIGVTCCLVSASDSSGRFGDVSEKDWFFAPVEYVCQKGIMNGSGDGLFSPNTEATRGMVVTMLYRLDGSPEEGGEHPFYDVSPEQYFCAPVIWAVKNGIADGTGGGYFSPNAAVSREQLAVMLHRYASYKGADSGKRASLETYSDSGRISAYAVDAMSWAVAEGIISGVSESELQPGAPALRSQVAGMMMRFDCLLSGSPESPEPEAEDAEYVIHRKNDSDENAEAEKPERPRPSEAGDAGEDEDDGAPAEGFTLTVIGAKAAPGETGVKARIAVRGNPGILGMRLIVSYDESALTLTGVSNGSALDGVLTLTPGKTLKSGCAFLWDGLELSDGDIKDGDVLELRFDVSSGAESGSYPISVSFRSGDIIGNDLEALEPETESGFITVEQ